MKKEYNVIGLMSGTSLDGLDIAFCHFMLNEDNDTWSWEIVQANCIDYEPEWKIKLQSAHLLNGLDLMVLHKAYGSYLGESVNDFISKHNLDPDFISSHGHTIFHDPQKMLSFQLGDGAAIYAKTGLPVVCDFRSVDICLGGQGAPLVPIGDALLFPEYDYCLNLGGIANISINNLEDKTLAWDICGCNLLLNALAHEKGLDFDKDGLFASKGLVDDLLLEKLNNWAYLSINPPKSLDKETMLAELMPVINGFAISTEDKLATVADHITSQIANSIVGKTGKMLITGGGAMNTFLINTLKVKSGLDIVVRDENLIAYKEALIFAFLGVLRVRNENNALASVTGAKWDSIGGAFYGPFHPVANKNN